MFTLRPQSRACGGCTRCCEGWLTGEAWGHHFAPGRACGWLGRSGCTIYEQRPFNPCQTFLCEWKRDPAIPQWLWPRESGVILISRVLGEHNYLRVIPSPGPVSDRIHEWAQQHSHSHSVNILVPGSDQPRIYSTDPQFLALARQTFGIAGD